jgi:hypothetical protein
MTTIELFRPADITTIELWRSAWSVVGRFERDRPWVYGDLFLRGKDFVDLQSDQFYTWDETVARILKLIPLTGVSPKTITNWAFVAQKFEPKNRIPDLSWSHHREVVDLPLKEAVTWLVQAKAGDWPVEELRQRMAEKNGSRSSGPPVATFIPRKAVSDQVRWFRHQFEDEPLEDWAPERRAALKREYQPLMDILTAL